jgi:hypothetical protein
MINIPLYQRWMARRWLMMCLRMTVAMLVLFSFFDALNQWDIGRSTLLSVTKWVLRRTPLNLYELLPFAVLLSAMVTATQWVKHSEWVLIRFAGWSWRYSLAGLVLGGLFWGCIGLLADTLNARWIQGVTVSRQATWIQSGGYIFKIGQIHLTGSDSAELHSTYIYPDSFAVEQGHEPNVNLFPTATLQHNQLILPTGVSNSLPTSIPLPFYLILEQHTLERLDLFFLLHTLRSLTPSETNSSPSESILHFTLVKKLMYPIWMIYWMAWGSLLFMIPPRFKDARLYQSILFAWGAIWMFMYRTLSSVLMQKEISGWWMNGLFLLIGLLILWLFKSILKRKVGST